MTGRRKKWDYRVICPCQQHAGRRKVMGWARIAAQQLQKRAVALVIGVPLAFGALGFPMDAMNVSFPLIDNPHEPVPQASFRIFSTQRLRETFLQTAPTPQTFTLEVAKEQFFRTEVPYGPIIYSEARRNDLSPELVAAVVEAESDFRPRLVSNKNAQGLMQIVPETGQLLGCENPFNPAENIAAGAKYLRYLLDRFGDQRMALAAYNAGEGTIEKFGGIPPFPETLNYLQRVASGTRLYRQRIQNRFVASVRLRTTAIE